MLDKEEQVKNEKNLRQYILLNEIDESKHVFTVTHARESTP